MEIQKHGRPQQKRVFVLGGTGTIGIATVRALVERGYDVTAFVRASTQRQPVFSNVEYRIGDVTSPDSLRNDGFRNEHFDILISCLASRNGSEADAWRIDHQAHVDALAAARDAGVAHMILLSALCVQKPMLPFQYAKLAFEAALMNSGIAYSIVRPTAFFKSLSGQVERIRKGKPFLLFGNGELTACKPISDHDLAVYLVDCIDNPERKNTILPIGGPGGAITPKQQGEMLFALLGKEPRFRHVPVGLLDGIIAGLNFAGRFSSRAGSKAQLARIGRYYATESMLLWDESKGRYVADATPITGSDSLEEHYRLLLAGEINVQMGEHSIF